MYGFEVRAVQYMLVHGIVDTDIVSLVERGNVDEVHNCSECPQVLVHTNCMLRIIWRCFSLQARYADGTKKMLQSWFDEKDFPEEWYIVREGKLADQYK